jgi:hypothetical protein
MTRPSESPNVRPITWRSLPGLARWTASEDRRLYVSKGRPLSPRRIAATVTPALKRPIFVVGAPRSGTTFLGDSIGALPSVSYHFEPIATKAAARYVFDASWGERRARAFYRSTYGWLLRQHLDADLRFVEKTPQNSFVVPFLARAFPDAQFIHIIRDGRDVALSYSKEPWLQAASLGSDRWEPGGYRWGPYARFWVERERVDEFESTSDLHRCIWAWRRFTEAALAAGADLSSAHYLELRYEDVVTEPGAAAELLLEFLGEYGQDARTALQRALSGARPGSVGRWRNELTTQMRETVEREAGTLLVNLGYTW